jgi:hypothetical protein
LKPRITRELKGSSAWIPRAGRGGAVALRRAAVRFNWGLAQVKAI